MLGLEMVVILGVAAWLYSISRPTRERGQLDEIEHEFAKRELEKKWPPLSQAEFHRVVAERCLKTAEGAEKAQEKFVFARNAALQAADSKQKPDTKQILDRDFFLIELARTQIELGGSEKEVLDKARLGWEREVTIEVDLPKAGGPATVRWFYNQDPGIFGQSHDSCVSYNFHGHSADETIGVRTVPRAIFESTGPANLSIEIQLDLPNDQGGTVHATERYALTIQRA